jgi:hypothetical protein
LKRGLSLSYDLVEVRVEMAQLHCDRLNMSFLQ